MSVKGGDFWYEIPTPKAAASSIILSYDGDRVPARAASCAASAILRSSAEFLAKGDRRSGHKPALVTVRSGGSRQLSPLLEGCRRKDAGRLDASRPSSSCREGILLGSLRETLAVKTRPAPRLADPADHSAHRISIRRRGWKGLYRRVRSAFLGSADPTAASAPRDRRSSGHEARSANRARDSNLVASRSCAADSRLGNRLCYPSCEYRRRRLLRRLSPAR